MKPRPLPVLIGSTLLIAVTITCLPQAQRQADGPQATTSARQAPSNVRSQPPALIRFIGMQHGYPDSSLASKNLVQALRSTTRQDVEIHSFEETAPAQKRFNVAWSSRQIVNCSESEVKSLLETIRSSGSGSFTREFKMNLGEDLNYPERIEVQWLGECENVGRKRSQPVQAAGSLTPAAMEPATITSEPELEGDEPTEMTEVIGAATLPTPTDKEDGEADRTEQPLEMADLPATTTTTTTTTTPPPTTTTTTTSTSSTTTATTTTTSKSGATTAEATTAPGASTVETTTAATTTAQPSSATGESSGPRALGGEGISLGSDSLFRDNLFGSNNSLFGNDSLLSNSSLLGKDNLLDKDASIGKVAESVANAGGSTDKSLGSTDVPQSTTIAAEPTTTTTIAPTTTTTTSATADSSTDDDLDEDTTIPAETSDKMEGAEANEPRYGKFIGLTTAFLIFVAYIVCARAYRRQGMYEVVVD